MTQMEQSATSQNDSQNKTGSEGDAKRPSTLVDALFDIGLAWADFGVGQGKRALEQSAKTLEKAAQSLSELQQKLRKDQAS